MDTFGSLKRCPFCNGKACIETGDRDGGVIFYAHCRKCGLRTKEYIVKANTEKDLGHAIYNILIAWNTRQEVKSNEKNKTK